MYQILVCIEIHGLCVSNTFQVTCDVRSNDKQDDVIAKMDMFAHQMEQVHRAIDHLNEKVAKIEEDIYSTDRDVLNATVCKCGTGRLLYM